MQQPSRDDLADLIAALDAVDRLHRWHRSLIEKIEKLDHIDDPPPPKLGIDLAEKHEDVRKLVGKFGLRACLANHWDSEDLLSDVYLKIARSNVGPNPFDPSRSTLGHYVVLVLQSVITNKWRKSTQRGRLSRTIAIDAPGVHEHLGRFEDFDAMLDTERAFERYRRERPELTEAFVDGASAIDVARAGLATRLGAYAARAGLRRAIAG